MAPARSRLGTQKCCAQLKTKALLDALAEGGFDAAFGGARREEEKSRAKERVYSFRDSLGQWDPKNQRPELWNLYNGRIEKGETIRVFPLSNWTELDVWHYIHLEHIPVVPLYFARAREVLVRNGTLLPLEHDPPRLPGRKTANGDVPHALAGLHAIAPAPCAAKPIRSPRSSKNCWRRAARNGRTASSTTTRKARWS